MVVDFKAMPSRESDCSYDLGKKKHTQIVSSVFSIDSST